MNSWRDTPVSPQKNQLPELARKCVPEIERELKRAYELGWEDGHNYGKVEFQTKPTAFVKPYSKKDKERSFLKSKTYQGTVGWCSFCGSPVYKLSSFCNQCGSPIDWNKAKIEPVEESK